MNDPVTIQAERTPNPRAIKFTTNRILNEGRAQTYSSPLEAFGSPLARALLAVPGVQSVFLLRNFVTVTRDEAVEWDTLTTPIEQAIRSSVE